VRLTEPVSSIEDDREVADRPGSLDAVVCLVFGEPQGVPAVDEERPIARPKVQATGVELSEMRDKKGRGAPLPSGQPLQPGDQLGVFEVTKGSKNVVAHALFLARANA
jgi:hypothetical protein